jgi:uncharacterized cysteine cluster protein YcgN (CxxCxxCC family)
MIKKYFSKNTSTPTPQDPRPRFWETIPLAQMNTEEWEALCDGCGKCCLHKIEYQDTGEIDYTCIACKLLDGATCRCMNYDIRHDFVPDCVRLTYEKLPETSRWMPQTCAYRMLYEGKALPDWHPLLTGDPESTHRAGNTLRGQVISETKVPEDDWEDYIISERP